MTSLKQNGRVKHSDFGLGITQVIYDKTAIVRFEHGLEEVKISDLELVKTLQDTIADKSWSPPLNVLCLSLASSIISVNDTWGLFSRSRITLLPHQLWVCRKVISNWPARWLVADDVGLGKTIEAGLILWPLLSRKRVKRLLIICPSSLVDQWQYRLRTMFDIRVMKYSVEIDKDKSDFWNSNHAVVASLETLRVDNKNRHQRLIESQVWDLIIVDEAHHLNADESYGPTLGYQLIQKMVEKERVVSMLFFTGTPHRGKDFGFLALLRLLRPELFNPRESMYSQLQYLSQVVIRNNKQNVTDLNGKKLFKPQIVIQKTFEYTIEESEFYNLLTEFIVSGKAYASSLGFQDQRLVMLVLICMQKLASSSIAAIKRALNNRLDKLHDDNTPPQSKSTIRNAKSIDEMDSESDGDTINQAEEKIAEDTSLNLIDDEEKWLRLLIAAAESVRTETKIELIIDLLENDFKNRSVLLYTEYKATQALIVSKLINRYGKDQVVFINGEGLLEDVIDEDGNKTKIRMDRESASDRFNNGSARFLISTEAAGEGIDLQESCYSLVHIDLPWNPMRLHQRVGRLNRYGQKHQVEVVSLRNPDTVEARIWDKLNEKIDNIMLAFTNFMDDPEDLYNLVLGMTSPSMFRELFAEASQIPKDRLSQWFDEKTATFGGQNVINTVREIFGNCSRFDYQQAKLDIPRMDLPDLQSFFESMLIFNRRRFKTNENGTISFKTPDEWKEAIGIQSEYNEIVFERNADNKNKLDKIFGVGHVIVEKALNQALEIQDNVCVIAKSDIQYPMIVVKARDRVTNTGDTVRYLVFGLSKGNNGWSVLKDWEIIKNLNPIMSKYQLHRKEYTIGYEQNSIELLINESIEFFKASLHYTDLPFKVPEIEIQSIIYPGEEELKDSQKESAK